MLIIKGSFNTQVATALNLSTHYGKIYTFFFIKLYTKGESFALIKGK
jgi:hypothetical protein